MEKKVKKRSPCYLKCRAGAGSFRGRMPGRDRDKSRRRIFLYISLKFFRLFRRNRQKPGGGSSAAQGYYGSPQR